MTSSLGGAEQRGADGSSLPPTGRDDSRPARWPTVLIGAGIAGIVLAVLIGFVLPVVLILGVIYAVVGGGEELISGVSQPADYTLEHGDTLVIYAPDHENAPYCNVQDSAGSDVMPTAELPSAPTGTRDEPWEPVLAYPAVQGETYTIDCLGDDVRVGPPIPIGRVISAVVAMVIGALLGLVSLILVISGVAAAVLTRRR